MARGITETDIWQAADALLLEGQRPTIERVRGKIGRGSPNTVAPHLETWFRHLGSRIQDPGAFSAPPAVPDPILQAAQHFWEVALSLGREASAEQIATAQADAQAQVATATELQRQAELEATQLRQRLQELAAELDQRSRAVEAERISHAGTRTRLDGAQAQIAQQTERLAALDNEVTAAREQARGDIAIADERAQAAERRAALDIDRERQARARADKQTEQLGAQLETRRQAHQAELLKTVEQSVRQSAELQALRSQVQIQSDQLGTLQRQLQHAQQDSATQLALRHQAELQSAALQREFTTWRQTQSAARPIRKSLRSPAMKKPAG
jgi:chromosome segregation ATPase